MSVIVKRKPVPPLGIVLTDCLGDTLTLDTLADTLQARVKVKGGTSVEISPSDAHALARVLVEWADSADQA